LSPVACGLTCPLRDDGPAASSITRFAIALGRRRSSGTVC
jgi:hypothetical protein